MTTLPPETFGTYRGRGNPKVRVANGLSGARYLFQALTELRIDQQRIWRELEEEGAAKFIGSYDRALETLQKEKGIQAVRRSA